jgi:hypothetical protein
MMKRMRIELRGHREQLLTIPSDFPRAAADSIHKRVTESHLSMIDPDAFKLFAGGWNGLIARFTLCAESDAEFRLQVREQTMFDTERERYMHDLMLFQFFVGGLAAIECLHFALFALGALANPAAFPVRTDADLRAVNPQTCAAAFGRAFAGHPLTATLGELQADPKLKDWSNVRNVLAHRLSPGWNIEVGGEKAYVKWLGISLDMETTASRRKWLSEWLARMLAETDAFTAVHLVPPP